MKTVYRGHIFFTLQIVFHGFIVCWFAIVALSLATWSAHGQSTMEFGFEEYTDGATLPFAKQIMSRFPPQVVSSTSPVILPFEGQKFLYASGRISFGSPNGMPIQSFTLHAYTVAGTPVTFYVGGQTVQQFGSWQTVQGSFVTPVQSFVIFAADTEDNPYTFAIDAVQFTTVPEPKTFWMLPIGLTAIAFRPLLKRPKPTRA